MRVIGITGPIAAGKSTVDDLLRELGADPIIDADAVVHELYATSPALRAAIAATFGPQMQHPDGTIDRRALGARVFGDAAALQQLQDLVYPATRAAIRARLAQAPRDGIAVIDAVKLLQGELSSLCTERWWIAADPVEQRRRLVDQRGLTAEETETRLAAQPRLEEWRHLIDRVIDNSGTLDEIRHQVTDAWNAFVARTATA